MKILTSWLKEFVDCNAPVTKLAHDLTMAGLEVEGIEQLGDGDAVIEVSITPNRPDCLSVLGIARDVSAIYSCPVLYQMDLPPLSSASDFAVPIHIEAPALCPRYAAASLSGVTIASSPDWLVKRLAACGVRSINNVVDATNYVMLELGQPLHAFDLERLNGPGIVVRTAPGERLTTLDGKERVFEGDMLAICDMKCPVAVAGVMGGADSEVTDRTRNVLLEAAFFNPDSIRRTSRMLRLSTEASYRFERGVDPELPLIALKRTVELLQQLGALKQDALYFDNYAVRHEPPVIHLRTERLARLLGLSIPLEEVVAILARLGVKIQESTGILMCIPPSFRPDLKEEIDLVEEVARIYSYDRLGTDMPRAVIAGQQPESRWEQEIKLKNFLVSQGLTECISYSFCSPEEISGLFLANGDTRTSLVRLQNPLTEELSVMRTSLVPCLLSALARNNARGVNDVKLFELGRVFYAQGRSMLPVEERRCAVLFAGSRYTSSWAWSKDGVDLFDVKGIFENIVEFMRLEGVSLNASSRQEPFYLPGSSAWIVVDDRQIGSMGCIAPAVLERFDIRTDSKAGVFVLDISFDGLCEARKTRPVFKALPKYPAISRDAAIIVTDEISWAAVQEFIASQNITYLENVTLFDLYTGKPIPKGYKSMGLRMVYRSMERTLTEEDIAKGHQGLVDSLIQHFQAQLRA
jgi:phenylalanyl-tRNA synthetase beta chain